MRGTNRVAVSIVGLALVLAACNANGDAPEDDPGTAEEPVTDVDEDGQDEDVDAVDEDVAADAPECGTYSLVVLDDDSHRMLTYGIESGEVDLGGFDGIDIDYVQIPALVAATGTDQYDVVQTSLPGVVFANAAGADTRIIAAALAHTGGGMKVFSRADSGIDEPSDLAGQTIGISSFGSTAALQTQIALFEAHGIDAQFEGGELDWVELDPPTLLNALQTGQVDAAALWHTTGWMALNDDELQVVVDTDVDYHEVAGEWPVGSAMTVLGEKADGEPECVAQFQRILEESEAYAEANVAELAEVIAAETGQPAEFIEYWWGSGAYEMGATLQEPWSARAEAFYEAAVRNEMIPPASLDDFAFRG